MDAGIGESIAAALASRRSQQASIDGFLQAWTLLADDVDSLIAAVKDAGAQAASSSFGELDSAGIEAVLQKLRRAISSQTPNMQAISHRVHRPTVNIGVIGRTRAGKSTFLRMITGLDKDVIPPAGKSKPTTAARSRFRNDPGRADAEVELLAWQLFRDEYVAPLHKEAGCPLDEVPITPEKFISYPYRRRLESSPDRQATEKGISPQDRLKRLCLAQDSFDSYGPLLTGPDRLLRIGRLAELRPYVAYPADDSDMHRPYHAVRDVRVYHRFADVDVEKLELVDLPGAGEAGLDIDRRFLKDLKNDVDVLLHITRPIDEAHTFFDSEDSKILDLADAARMGVGRADFIYLVINEDRDNASQHVIDNVVTDVGATAARNKIMLVIGNASDETEARVNILEPVLRKLAGRLAAMDRAAASTVASDANAVAEEAVAITERLAADIDRWQLDVPSESKALAVKAKALRDDIADGLLDLREQYVLRARDKEPIPEIEQGISRARRRLDAWAKDRLDTSVNDERSLLFHKKLAGDPDETPSDACTVVRQKIREEFGQIDSSLDGARRRVHREIADLLRARLVASLVPEGDQAFRVFLDATRDPEVAGLHSALAELEAFRTGYESMFRRVARPVIAQITLDHARAIHARRPSDQANDPDHHSLSDATSPFYDGMRKIGQSMAGAGQPLTVATGVAAGIALVKALATLVPIIAEQVWPEPITHQSAEGYRKAILRAFNAAVALIEKGIRNEAIQLNEALAAVVDEFYDGFTRVPVIEDEYEKLCYPIRRELWPAEFDGGAAELAGRLRRLRDTVASTTIAARSVMAAASSVGVSQ